MDYRHRIVELANGAFIVETRQSEGGWKRVSNAFTLKDATDRCVPQPYVIVWHKKKEENMSLNDRPYTYEITQQADGRFKVALHWCGSAYTYEDCATHNSLRSAIEHCQKRNSNVPYTVTWYEEPKKSV